MTLFGQNFKAQSAGSIFTLQRFRGLISNLRLRRHHDWRLTVKELSKNGALRGDRMPIVLLQSGYPKLVQRGYLTWWRIVVAEPNFSLLSLVPAGFPGSLSLLHHQLSCMIDCYQKRKNGLSPSANLIFASADSNSPLLSKHLTPLWTLAMLQRLGDGL